MFNSVTSDCVLVACQTETTRHQSVLAILQTSCDLANFQWPGSLSYSPGEVLFLFFCFAPPSRKTPLSSPVVDPYTSVSQGAKYPVSLILAEILMPMF